MPGRYGDVGGSRPSLSLPVPPVVRLEYAWALCDVGGSRPSLSPPRSSLLSGWNMPGRYGDVGGSPSLPVPPRSSPFLPVPPRPSPSLPVEL